MQRRTFLLSAAAVATLTALGLKPTNRGEDYTPYFAHLNRLLKTEGNGRPALLVDLDTLDHNIQQLTALIPEHANYRVVVKSLPSPQLLGYVMQQARTNRLMLFHQPFLNQVALDYPTADVLMGKPMPIQAVATFYQQLPVSGQFNAPQQLQWLIDSRARLQQYLALARRLNTRMRINIEIDVGLHRGGLQHPDDLTVLLDIIRANSAHLAFAGFMGYDPHVVKLPPIIKSVDDAFADSQAIYQQFIDKAKQHWPDLDTHSLCLNGAGSPTVPVHAKGTLLNDIAAGSCLVKPLQFDTKQLTAFKAATYIATPVLKKLAGTHIPGIEATSKIQGWWDPNKQHSLFIYGGKWQAQFESPQGLQGNGLFGQSSNQDIVNCSEKVNISVDDYVFLRPEQSEFVFLQFGDILAIRNQHIEARWPVLSS